MNEDSGFSHMRRHLGVKFLCGGCLAYKHLITKNMGLHMQVCSPCRTAHKGQGVKEPQLSSKGSKNKKDKANNSKASTKKRRRKTSQ